MKAFQEPLFRPDSGWKAPNTLPNLAGVRRLAIDIETCDPDLLKYGPGVRRGAYIVGLAIGIEGGARAYYPIRHEGGGNCVGLDVLGWARSALNDYDGELVGAKLDYDLDFLAEEGITFPHVKAFHDVQVAEPLLDEWRLEYNLDALSKDYLGEGKDEKLLREAGVCYGFKTAHELKVNLWRLPANLVGPYAEADVDRPLRILPLQLERLAQEGLEEVYAIERKLLPVLLAMRRRGVRIDLERAQRVRAAMVGRREALLARFKRLAGPKAEFMAPDSFVRALEDRNIHPPLTPKSGKPSITKAFLESYSADPLCAVLAEGRRVNTIINTFLDGHILGHHINGRIHCLWNQLKGEDGGTIGRLSSSLPNLQNLPARDEELAPLIRAIFLPEPGEKWQRIDLSQIEYRYLAHFAIGRGAEEARRKYNEDPTTDFHVLCGEFTNADARNPYVRKKIKNLNFCKVYGGGSKKVALMIGCSVETAQVFMDKYDSELPFVSETYRAAMHWGERRGFVVTILGRKQRFTLWEPMGGYGSKRKPALRYEQAVKIYGERIQKAYLHAALNRKLQGSAADHIKKAMVDCWDSGVSRSLGAALVTVHDELGNSVPDTVEGGEAAKEAKNIMENCIKLRVPISAESSQGGNWGECG